MTLKFLRNKVVEVEPQNNGDLGVSWRLTDDLIRAEIRLTVRPPQLEIIEADARVEGRAPQSNVNNSEKIKDVEGVSIGPGLRKIAAGMLGGPDGDSILVDAVLECANAVILHFTQTEIESMQKAKDQDDQLVALRNMLKANPRLKDSCIAFQRESPIMKGMDL